MRVQVEEEEESVEDKIPSQGRRKTVEQMRGQAKEEGMTFKQKKGLVNITEIQLLSSRKGGGIIRHEYSLGGGETGKMFNRRYVGPMTEEGNERRQWGSGARCVGGRK